MLSKPHNQFTLLPWFFLFPGLFLLFTFVFLPILSVLFLSVTTGHLTRSGVSWVGLRHYLNLLSDPDFWQVLGNTVYFTVATVIPSVVIPLGLAVALDQAIPGRGILRTLYFLPAVISIVAAGLGWRWLLQPQGFFGDINWLGDPRLAMVALILLSIWKQLGFNMVVFLAGLQAIPHTLYEAAIIDGANSWQLFRYITLPGLRPTTIFVIIATTIFTFRSFEQVYVLTGGGPLNSTNILVYYIYEQAFSFFDFGYGAALTIVLLVIVMGLVYWQWRTWQGSN
ncbi:MAG: sugar ABC transporter permease [Pseudanabaenaceae cyanobacterium SKYGB_i_bin29]|nr:sugar ABC transporter permease [Pseudanabaenaceae cyanobacterium SKYG29]MDW8421435.1 sugar ABC transporter permease [Pseudanabaenaceae cyanobacterium SKYGB_i_bin29]